MAPKPSGKPIVTQAEAHNFLESMSNVNPIQKALRVVVNAAETLASVGKGVLVLIDPDRIKGMSSAELRAIAHDRGYKVDIAGAKTVRRQFLEQQAADPRFQEALEALKKEAAEDDPTDEE